MQMVFKIFNIRCGYFIALSGNAKFDRFNNIPVPNSWDRKIVETLTFFGNCMK